MTFGALPAENVAKVAAKRGPERLIDDSNPAWAALQLLCLLIVVAASGRVACGMQPCHYRPCFSTITCTNGVVAIHSLKCTAHERKYTCIFHAV